MILITGATGLLGSHLIKTLAEQNADVKALYRSSIPNFAGAEKIKWVKGDILDVNDLEDAMQNVQQVYHCAGMVSFSPKKKHELFQTNVEGTTNVINACINCGVQKLLFVSSVSALGRIRENEQINESMNWSEETSNSEYGKSKYLAEMQVWRGIGEGLNAVIVNPVIILGAGDWQKGSSEIFKSVYNEFPWCTDGVSGFVDVEDVVKAMIMLMKSEIISERFIISAANISYKELFDMIAENFEKKLPHKKVTPLIAAIVWRMQALKKIFTGKDPLITKETAKTALAKVYFDNSKLLQALPAFNYTSLNESIKRICSELKKINNLQ
jgi:nucleoside-diphosphate-sugar epimerase